MDKINCWVHPFTDEKVLINRALLKQVSEFVTDKHLLQQLEEIIVDGEDYSLLE